MKLTQDQEKFIKRLGLAWNAMKQELVYIQEAYERDKDRARGELRKAVLEAEALGIPKRQIYLAMGLNNQNQLIDFMTPRVSSAGKTLRELTSESWTPENVGEELAQVVKVDPFEFVSGNDMFGVYRDTETGVEYRVGMYKTKHIHFMNHFGNSSVPFTEEEKDKIWSEFPSALIGQVERLHGPNYEE